MINQKTLFLKDTLWAFPLWRGVGETRAVE